MTVKQLRIEKDWTQFQLALFSGASVATIQRAEKDASAVSKVNRKKIAQALGVKEEALDG